MQKSNIAITNKEVLELYYGRAVPYVNVKDIQRIFNIKYKAAVNKRNLIQDTMARNGQENPTGYVPFDEVLKLANTNIDLIERNYTKEKKLGL